MIEFQQVSRHYGEQDVLIDASFRILPGERVGIVGPNGAGKSTVFGLIEGQVSPAKGFVLLPKDIRLGHLRQQLNAHAVETSLLGYTERAIAKVEEIGDQMEDVEAKLAADGGNNRKKLLDRLGQLQHDFEHLGGYELRTRAETALSGLGFHVDEFQRPFRSFSGGWQMRAELARTLIGYPDVLLLDEPSNYLDLPAVEWLQRFLRDFPGTLLIISHDRYLLESLTTTTLEIAHARVTRYAGDFAYYLRERENRFLQRAAAFKNQERKREQIERFVERFRSKNTKASQVQSRIKMLEKMETIDMPEAGPDLSRIRIAPPPHCGAEVVRLESIGHSYDQERWIVRDVDLAFDRGAKIALIGYNGMGKSTLLRILAGVIPPSEGQRVLGHQVVVGYQSQEFAETMPPEKTAFEIVRAAHPSSDERSVRSLLGNFGFSGAQVDKPCDILSGGEKIRLAFARIFINPPNFLILDEPTTHLDIHGREALEAALSEYAGTVCLVSHDVTFVRNVADQIVAMTPPGVTRYVGNYDYFREKSGQEGSPPSSSSSTSSSPSKSIDRKSERRERAQQRQALKSDQREHKKRVRKAEQKIEKLEAEQANLLEVLSSGEDIDYAETNRRLGEIQAELAIEMEDWEKALEALDEVS